MNSMQVSYFMLERGSTDTRLSVNSTTSAESLEDALFDYKHGIIPKSLVKGTEIRPIYKRSFAYNWMRISLPEILKQVYADLLSESEELINKYGPATKLQIEILGYSIQYLRSSLLRNRRLELFTGVEQDKEDWNKFINSQKDIKLFQMFAQQADAYMQRKLASLFENMPTLRTHDFYQMKKLEMWQNTEIICGALAEEYRDINYDFEGFKKLLHNCIWSNIFGYNYGYFYDYNSYALIYKRSRKRILVDNSLKVWNTILETSEKRKDFIVSNVGVDLFSLLLLAHFLLENKLAPKIRFHVRPMPWGLTKVTHADMEYMLEFLGKSENKAIKEFGVKFKQYFDTGEMELASKNYFWTSPHEYYKMKEVAKDLYYELSAAGMLFVQGDSNYRRLVSDIMWDSTQAFITTLRGFQPTNICAIRLIKSDHICGLKFGESVALRNKLRHWKYMSRFGVIQFAPLLSCNCEFLAKPKPENEDVQPKLSYCQKMKLQQDNMEYKLQ